ncbi:transmembrane protein 229B isoform X2 [Anser cygnoides]|uniref:transmembrane protein 229B isoform X2 n=1 Tax=Anser cygnoides TaxID=8845 RepID=UPI0034D364D4
MLDIFVLELAPQGLTETLAEMVAVRNLWSLAPVKLPRCLLWLGSRRTVKSGRTQPRQRRGSCQEPAREGCLVGVLAVGHTQQARKRQASEAAWTCWRQPGCSADAVSPEQSGTQKRESSRIPPQKRQRRAVTCLAANTAADHLPQIICICPPCRFPEHLRSREEPR